MQCINIHQHFINSSFFSLRLYLTLSYCEPIFSSSFSLHTHFQQCYLLLYSSMKNIRFSSNLSEQRIPTGDSHHSHARPPNHNQVRPLRSNLDRAYLSQRKKEFQWAKMPKIQQKYNQLLKIREQLLIQYQSLMQFYETNEQKLRRIIMKELNQNNSYLYTKEVMMFIKFPKHEVVKVVNFDMFCHDLSKLTSFLSSFNAKKRIKQVEIIKQSMLSRQLMIRQSSSHQEYEDIYKNMRVPLKNSGFSIYDQYKSIRADHNLPLHSDNVHERLYNKMCDAEECVSNVMKNEARTKERQKLYILGLSIPKETCT